jgi:16S rRNA (guanine966-N2)-methyltransferase
MTIQNKQSQAGRLRIVAGIWRSRFLKIADVPGLRPTAARIRETLFNWLTADLPGARCLDLCAGTGVLGLEALSRGAASVVFVEKSKRAMQILRENIDTLDAAGAELWHGDARRYLSRPDLGVFDLVFLDPPYAADIVGELCRLLERHKALAKTAAIYIEYDKREAGPKLPASWQVLKKKTAGNVCFLLAAANTMESD